MAIGEEDLNRFLHGYWGYGTFQAGFWFVGPEEGGEETWPDFCNSVRRWNDNGCQPMLPFRASAKERDRERWFGPSPKLQRYWMQLCRIYLAATGQPGDVEAIRTCQARKLASHEGDTCLVELLPLRARSLGRWPYADQSEFKVLQDRMTYQHQMLPRRIAAIRELIERHRPHSVVFVGVSYRRHWEQVAGTALGGSDPPMPATRDGTTYLLVKHPSSRGTKNTYFEEAGRSLTTQTK